MKFPNILETIGNTPQVRINKLFDPKIEVWMKLERTNPGASIKDRIALAMIEDAEEKGLLTSDSVIVEPTSGNTGIGLALVAAVKGYRLILVMPESMSLERRHYMQALGAELELTPREKGMPGAIAKAEEMVAEDQKYWMPAQFSNHTNIAVHTETTAKEILADFPEGLDYLVCGVGTGGHISGCAQTLKAAWPNLKVIAVEPEASPVISGGQPGPHMIQGIGAGFIPENLKIEILDEVIQVSNPAAYDFTRRCASQEGIVVGISSGASLAAIHQIINDLPEGSRVLTFAYDTGERYLSVDGLFD